MFRIISHETTLPAVAIGIRGTSTGRWVYQRLNGGVPPDQPAASKGWIRLKPEGGRNRRL